MPQDNPINPCTIQVMDDILASQVAAGEVVERPASVLKELVENSIDAGAGSIRVEIERGGIAMLRVTDDGCGMSSQDSKMSLLRHSTSKLKSFDDLFNIQQMGFRGEAIPSIASVSQMRIITRRENDIEGSLIEVEGGIAKESRSIGCARGTSIEVSQLFYNTPVRRKFLKSEETEASHIEHQLKLHALAYPHIRFILIRKGAIVLDSPATQDLRTRIADFLGRELAQELICMQKGDAPGVEVHGYLAPLSTAKRNRKLQYIFLNGRPIEDRFILRAVKDGYGGLPTGLHPSIFLYLTVDPGLVDVNVHPAKKEVRFRRPGDIASAVMDAIIATLSAKSKEATHASVSPTWEGESRDEYLDKPTKPRIQLRPLPRIPQQSKLSLNSPSASFTSSPARETAQADVQGNSNLPRNSDNTQVNSSPTTKLNVSTELSRNDSRTHISKSQTHIAKISDLKVASQQEPPSQQTEQLESIGGKSIAKSSAGQQSSDFQPSISERPVVTAIDPLPYTALIGPQTSTIPSYRHIGSLLGEFILFESKDGLVLLSPRAARERLIFERLMESDKRRINKQRLLLHILLEMDERDLAMALDLKSYFEKSGFEISSFGNRTLRIDAIPSILPMEKVENFVYQMIESFGPRGEIRIKRSSKPFEAFAQQLARKYAMQEDISGILAQPEQILADLLCCEIPYCTPSGKPTMHAISSREIMNKFHR